MFNWTWKTVSTTTTSDSRNKNKTKMKTTKDFGNLPKDFSDSFKEAADQFREAASEFDSVGEDFGLDNPGSVTTVEFYGDSKEDAISTSNEWAKKGYKMTSIKQSEKLDGLWIVEMVKHEN